ncbi:MAG: TolC family protein, partial [Methylococcaceae bacterium]
LQAQARESKLYNSLSLPEAIQHTFNNNPELQTFQYRLEAQQGRIVQADLSAKPKLDLVVEDALGTGEYNVFDSTQTTLSISWVLDGGIRGKRTAVAFHGKGLIESEQAIKRLDSATQTAHYFIKALSCQERIDIAKLAIILAETTVKEIKYRVKVGKTPQAELYRAEAELAKRQLVLLGLNNELASLHRQLAAQWGSTEPRFSSVSGSLTRLPNVIDFQTLKSQIKHNPNLSKYLSQQRVTEATLQLAEEQRNLKWSVTAGVRHFAQTDDMGIIAGFSIPLGITNRNQGRIVEVQANLAKNQSEADALRIRIETSLFIFYQQLEHSIHLSEVLQKDVIPRLKKALKATHKAYEIGRYSYLEWQSVQNELLDAQSALLNASLSAHQNKIEIERLTGAHLNTPF